MPRVLKDTSTFDLLEEEVFFTRAAIKADVDAQELVPQTDGWLPWIEETRRQDRDVRAQVVETEAERVMSNARLNMACVAFGDELYLSCMKDRKSTRWLQFFKVPVSAFIRQPFGDQTLAVRGWLLSSQDPVLEHHRAALEDAVQRSDRAQIRTRSLATTRGENWIRREALVDELVRARDALHILLVQRAQERRLARDWPSSFFRATPRATPQAEGDESTGETPT